MAAVKGRQIGRRHVIGEAGDLEAVDPRQRVDLTGELVFMSKDGVEPGEGYVPQPARITSLKRPWDARNRIDLWVRKEALDAARETKASDKRWRFLFDRILAWGLLQSRSTVVIHGTQMEHSITLETMVFSDHALTDTNEYMMSREAFGTELRDRVERILQQHPGYRIVYLDDLLPDLPDALASADDFHIEMTNQPLRMPAFYGIEMNADHEKRLFGWGASMMLVLGVAGYAGLVASGWNVYQAAVNEYDTEVAPVADVYNNGENTLERLENQERFLGRPTEEPHRVQTIRSIAAYVANRDAAILSRIDMTMNPDLGSDGNVQYASGSHNTDFTVNIGVPAREEVNALKQARPMMDRLSSEAGVALRMVDFKPRTISTGDQKDAKYRFYTLEGTVPTRWQRKTSTEAAEPAPSEGPRMLGAPELRGGS